MIENLKPYGEYKSSNLEWLQNLPTHWTNFRLDHLFNLRNEMPLATDGRVTGYLSGRVTLRSNMADQKIKGVVKDGGWRRIHKGDFAISGMNAHLGGMGVSDSFGKCSPIYLILQPKESTNAHFIAHLMRHVAHLGVLKSYVNTIRYNSADFKQDALKLFRLPLPPLEEQNAIVRFLEFANHRIEQYIRAKRKLIALLNEQKQAIIHQAVTKGLDASVPMKDSGVPWLGEIPAHWDYISFARLSRVIRGASPRPAGDPRYFHGTYMPWLTVGEVTKDSAIFLESTVTALTREGVENSVVFPKDTLVLTNSGATLGVPKILAIDVCANDGVVAFSKLSTRVNSVFAYYYLSTLTMRLRDELRQGGTQPNLNIMMVRSIVCPIPPIDEQKNITMFLEDELRIVNETISRAEREIALMREYRTRLVADVVTGQVDVREAVRGLPEVALVASEELAEDFSDDEATEGETEP
jgi:type I restriction enzyme, S subunit